MITHSGKETRGWWWGGGGWKATLDIAKDIETRFDTSENYDL